jgi:hypothetical protein
MNYKKKIKISLISAIFFFIFFQSTLIFNKYLGLNDIEQYTFAKREWIRTGINKEKNKKTVVTIGDSKLASGFHPKTFDAENNYLTNSYNLAIASHDITRNLFILKDFIKYNEKPNLILLDISYPRELKNSWDESLEERIYYFKKSKNYIFLTDFIIPALNGNKLINFFRNIILNNKNIEIKKKEIKNYSGAYYWLGEEKSVGKNFTDRSFNKNEKKSYDINETYKAEIEKFLNYTLLNNIDVIIIYPPAISNSNIPIDNIPSAYLEIIKKYKNVSSTTYINPFIDSENFMDRGHVNINGAIIYTKTLATNMIKEKIYYYR